MPLAVKKKELFYAYDDTRSIGTKSVWTSLEGFGGIALHGVELDNPDGRCPRNKPFQLLQRVVETQTCRQCESRRAVVPISSTAAVPKSREECEAPKSTRVVCSYELPQLSSGGSSLLAPSLPFERCSELVVEQIDIDANGTLHFVDNVAREHVS